MKKLRSIRSVRNLKGKKVLVRLSMNVPIHGRHIENDFRLRRGVDTLKFLSDKGAKVIAIAHIGRGKTNLLRPVVRHMNTLLPVGYLPDVDRARTKMFIEKMKDGSIFALENIRRFEGEVNNDTAFAKELSELGDIYVNEAFPASHRKHASIVGIPKFLPSYAGFSFLEEVKKLDTVIKPKKPFVIVLGGAKFETKIPLVKKFLPKADKIYISGALANTFFRELGFETGRSLVDDAKLNLKPFLASKKIVLPIDVVVKNANGVSIKSPNEVGKRDNILDVGPATLADIEDGMSNARMVLWNGPLGHFESGFSHTTESVARKLGSLNAQSIVGGGDTISAISKLNIIDKFTFVSAAGGAMLDYLADGDLPGINAIINSKV